jgi:hypothetical protein
MEAITEAFLEAAEVLYSGPVVMTAKDFLPPRVDPPAR